MPKFNLKTLCLSLATIISISTANPTYAWTGPVHKAAALAAVDYFPPAIRDMINKNKAAYLEGVETEPELYDKILDEKKDLSVELLRVRGFERYVYHLQRIKFFFDKKSDPSAQAAEIGALARLTTDLLEPFPSQDKFSPIQIAGHRVFFVNDFETYIKDFHFIYDGSQLIRDLPARLDKDLSLSTGNGEVIYTAYKKGTGFRMIESEAHAVLNRSLNLLADQVYSMQESRIGHAAPFDPSQYLGLSKFHKQSGIKEKKIPGPKAPTAPSSPLTPEKAKKNEKSENENSD